MRRPIFARCDAVEENRAIVANPRIIGSDWQQLDSVHPNRLAVWRADGGDHLAYIGDLGRIAHQDSDWFKMRQGSRYPRKNRRHQFEFSRPGVEIVRPYEVSGEMRLPFGGHPIVCE